MCQPALKLLDQILFRRCAGDGFFQLSLEYFQRITRLLSERVRLARLVSLLIQLLPGAGQFGFKGLVAA